MLGCLLPLLILLCFILTQYVSFSRPGTEQAPVSAYNQTSTRSTYLTTDVLGSVRLLTLTTVTGPGTNASYVDDGQGDRLRGYEQGGSTWTLITDVQDLAGGLADLVSDSSAEYTYLAPGSGQAPVSAYNQASTRSTYLATVTRPSHPLNGSNRSASASSINSPTNVASAARMASPFPALAARGSPIVPDRERSRVNQPKLAGPFRVKRFMNARTGGNSGV